MHIDSDELRLFKYVFETRSLTEAARRFPMSVSRASRMLSALRNELDDPLFERFDHNFYPTAKAREIYPKVSRVLGDIESLGAEGTFRPASLRRIFNVAGLDIDVVAFLPAVVESLRRVAPFVSINFSQVNMDFYKELKNGTLDLVLYPTNEEYPGFRRCSLCRDAFVYIAHRDSTLAARFRRGERLTDREVGAHLVTQVTIPFRNSENTRLGLFSTNVETSDFHPALFTSFQTTVPWFISGENATFLPFQTALKIKEFLPIEIIGRPFDADEYDSAIIWSETTEQDPAQTWMRCFITSEIRRIAGDPSRIAKLEAG